ncbi:interferon-inducible GTPase 5-like [Plectropomus leopardus]|uniref:interferon-inducible GTPase 5-like n=1 Tax=Plectropomus leopardus TaxID=160734 RepID=UPI001C4C1040|nr:interferon-inducible GTPase 5-like [Plectropomus leopardus]
MEDPIDYKSTEDIKKALESNNPALAVKMIQKYLDKENDLPLNIAVTGQSGSGKSSFINAFRGINDWDEGAAPTGSTKEITTEVTPYPHPNFPNVKLWDLPGIGTPNFPADKYLKVVGFENFDFFIIISADRFSENDGKLATDIKKIKKKFYFVRTKIDINISNEERRQRSEFNAENTLKQIKEYCIQSLKKQHVVFPQVFLVSNQHLRLYDFTLLLNTLERELPAHRRALLLAMPNINLDFINKKKKAFDSDIKYIATSSAAVAAVPVPGLSAAVDLSLLVYVVTQYVKGFGLDKPSLRRLADGTGVPLDDLIAIIVSPLAVVKITPELVLRLLAQVGGAATLLAAEEGSRFIPILGIPAAMALSFTFTYRVLKTFLDKLAEDAQRVFERALKG